MNRREFFKALTAAGIAASVPIALIQKASESHQFRRLTQLFDCGTQIGVGVSMDFTDGRRFRHAFLFHTDHWEAMTQSQQDEVWTRIEGHLVERARVEGFIS